MTSYKKNDKVVQNMRVFALISVISYLAHYIGLTAFGLYEDDYAMVVPALGQNLSNFISTLFHFFRGWPTGRPLGFAICHFLSFIGNNVAGLPGMYFIGYLIITTNSYLFYKILRRNLSETAALTGALVFLLFPADTSKTLLVHTFTLHVSMMFILIATLFYLSDKKIISYIFAAASLLTYESVFMLFFAVPLLNKTWDRRLVKKTIVHALVLVMTIFLVATVRLKLTGLIGNSVGLDYKFSHFLEKTYRSLMIGPIISLYSFYFGLKNAFFRWNTSLFILAASCFALLFSMFYFLGTKKSDENNSDILLTSPQVNVQSDAINRHAFFITMAKLVLTAILMLILGYALAFTHYPPKDLMGRMTSVHLAATFGSSLLFASLASLFIYVLNRYRLKMLAFGIIACYLSILSVYHFIIQKDFKESWKEQRWFWTEVSKECPDMRDGTILIYLREKENKYIQSNSWADDTILEKIYNFPKTWTCPPRLYSIFGNNWNDVWFVTKTNNFKYPREVIPPESDVILLKKINNKLVRVDDAIFVKEMRLHVMKRTTEQARWEKGVLYDLLMTKSGMHDAQSYF